MALDHWLKCIVISVLIGLTLAGYDVITSYTPMMAEENFSAMQNLVYEMVETQSTDIEFDTSKISDYSVVHKKDGRHTITISGNRLERMYITLNEDYQIERFVRNGEVELFFFWIFYIIVMLFQGAIITTILSLLYDILKKIVLFFKR